MTKTTNPNSTLESRIHHIFTQAAEHLATAVRQELKDVVDRVIGDKPAAAAKPAAPRSKPASAPAADHGRKPHPRRSYSDRDIDRVVELIASKPGLRSEQIKTAIGGDDRLVEKILQQLRTSGRVKTTGIKRAMTYAVSGAAPAPAAPAPAAKRKPGRPAGQKSAPKAAEEAPASAANSKFTRRDPKKIAAENTKILAFIKANPGLRSEQIQKALGFPKPSIASGLQKLRDEGQVKMNGLKRAATYSASA